jgi:hypothetical protein
MIARRPGAQLTAEAGHARRLTPEESKTSSRVLFSSRTGGRGLRIVEKLSTRWGTSTSEDGTTVWAEAPIHPQPAKSEMTAVGFPVVARENS